MTRYLFALLALLLLAGPASVGSSAGSADELSALLGTGSGLQPATCRIAALMLPGGATPQKMTRLPSRLPVLMDDKTKARPDTVREAKVRCGASRYYCPDSAPYCFMCKGRYACCSVKNVSRCC
ncbi:MAG: hypothetical protein C0605_03155 [Hyphomicrobiales bacterium]|nr:MAG: hypothetical protein C0605_03155 [Hyphomicrobiales bacterium]